MGAIEPASSRLPGRLSRRSCLSRAIGAAVLLAAVSFHPAAAQDEAGVFPFDPLPASVLASSPRKVFAHWNYFPVSLDNKDPVLDYYTMHYLRPEGERGKFLASGGYMRERPLPRAPIADPAWAKIDMADEVRRAAAIGIDGFIVNLMGVVPTNVSWQKFLTMLDAVEETGLGFRLIPSLDAAMFAATTADQVHDALQGVARRPGLLRTSDGRLVLSSFRAEAWPAANWQQLFAKLQAGGTSVAFVPTLLSWNPAPFAPFSYGLGAWGARTVYGASGLPGMANAARNLGRLWMAPVAPQDFRPHRGGIYWEAQNSGLFRAMWQQAIATRAEWVQLITWNDYSEATEIAPSTGIQYAFYDLAAYHIAWHKTGTAPKIVRDVLYYFHRVAPTTARPDPAKQPQPFALQGSDPARDEIELLALLKAPGVLEIEVAGRRYRKAVAQAGLTSFRVPLRAGVPWFRLYRQSQVAAAVQSAFPIRAAVTYQDLLYRAGSSSRPVVAMPANPPLVAP
jgi:hypothetical protein